MDTFEPFFAVALSTAAEAIIVNINQTANRYHRSLHHRCKALWSDLVAEVLTPAVVELE